MKLLRCVAVLAVATCISVCSLTACGEESESATIAATDAAIDRIRANPTPGPAPALVEASTPLPIVDASCSVLVEAPSIVPANHLPAGTAIAYVSNPPSSGPHYPSWANFQEYASPVPDGYLVHAMEHGAVVILYKCDALDGGSCSDLVTALRAVRDSVPTDPTCDPQIRVRVILAPRPTLDVPVAAAAWGYTYRAACVDGPSLLQFVTEHYAKAPEDFCAPGITSF